MKFTTPEDYIALIESIKVIDSNSSASKTTLTESTNTKSNIFESIGATGEYVRDESVKVIDTLTAKFNLERN